MTRLASLKLTLVILILLAAGVLVTYDKEVHTTWTLILPLALVAINLLAAIIVSPAFRRHPGLMVFHLALLAILVLVTAGRLTYLKGHVGLATGQAFEGELSEKDAGPWHNGDLEEVSFVNEGFTIDYMPGQRRGNTYNRVSWQIANGQRKQAVIGDNTPLELKGYTFHTTFNKGFAPVFLWQPDDGSSPVIGTINLPSYPLNDYRQALSWTPPGSEQELWVMLELGEDVLPKDQAARFRIPEAHHLILRRDDERHILRYGDRLKLAEGWITYQRLTTWMGYSVRYDWTIHWLFAAAAIGIAGLGWHYWAKYDRRPWRPQYVDTYDFAGDRQS
ncbi:cytochrome c biogenesis protein ResB [Marinobacter sp.]|uniref:cytochrome c biogenesis protein ResB n=1 Tax=Marinobacter sp. TaxID=50741 RepID=UPI002B48D368|nr:cytochrome c biogenesis protein ResB [Marinobacter sp.]HKK55696.1 cytochrome c biogenesis protein ResB [Marinobacter sp.]